MTRLIDADALKEAFERLGYTYRVTSIIDNSPTVYPICEDKACKYRANERTQGEWKRRAMNEYLCSNCHYNVNSVESLFYRFCPKCGADMRKGAEE